MTMHHVVPAEHGGPEHEMWECSALATLTREQLDAIEARGPRPSLHECGNHFVEVPDYLPD